MVASANIKTPSMTIPFLPHVTDDVKEKFRINLNRVTLANLIESVHVNEKIDLNEKSRRRLVRMRFEFLPRKSYKDKYAVQPPQILNYFEKIFIGKKFMVVLSTVIKDKKINIETNTDKKRTTRKKNDEDMEDEEAVGGFSTEKTMDQLEKG